MPSIDHEGLVELFRERATLALELLQRVFGLKLPDHGEIRKEESTLTDLMPTDYRADLVQLLYAGDKVVFGIVVEPQLSTDERKLFSWPVYATTLRARFECPCVVLVITTRPVWRSGRGAHHGGWSVRLLSDRAPAGGSTCGGQPPIRKKLRTNG